MELNQSRAFTSAEAYKKQKEHDVDVFSRPDVFQSVSSTNQKLMPCSLMQPRETVHQSAVCLIPFDTCVISLKLNPP